MMKAVGGELTGPCRGHRDHSSSGVRRRFTALRLSILALAVAVLGEVAAAQCPAHALPALCDSPANPDVMSVPACAVAMNLAVTNLTTLGLIKNEPEYLALASCLADYLQNRRIRLCSRTLMASCKLGPTALFVIRRIRLSRIFPCGAPKLETRIAYASTQRSSMRSVSPPWLVAMRGHRQGS